MTSVDLITNIAPHYRQKLWLRLSKLENYEIRYFYGVEPDSSIRQINFDTGQWSHMRDRLAALRNLRIRSVLIWQTGVLSIAMRSDSGVAVILGDMFVISNWLAAIIYRFRKRKVVFWGHGIYGDESWLKKRLRLSFLRLADANLVYGCRAKQLLINEGFSENQVTVVYNSLDYDLQRSLRSAAVQNDFFDRKNWFRFSNLPILVYIGRLTKQKNLGQLIITVNRLNSEGPRFNLLLVGDGPERQRLERMTGVESGTIRFHGPCYDESEISKLVANSDLCVSPGEIGLTAVHALSYGTPACTHDNMAAQMPEVEAIIEGKTGTFFCSETGDIETCIESWFRCSRNRGELREQCYRVIDTKFNPEAQCAKIRRALDTL